jgi:CRISPR-associated protein Csh2
VTVDITALIDRIEAISDNIDTVHVVASKYMTFSYDGDTGGQETLYDAIEDHVETDIIDVYS